MARSASLNPASMPFFPGGKLTGDDEGVSPFSRNLAERRSVSSASVSPSEYRSAKSSPSPSFQAHSQQSSSDVQRQQSPFHESPTFRHVEANRPYPTMVESKRREGSMLGVLDTLPENEDVGPSFPPPTGEQSGTQTPNSSFYSLQQRHPHSSSPIPPNQSTQTLGAGSFKSVSPVSSLDSGSQVLSTSDMQSFEQQLRNSPLIGEILERLTRCEITNREIQRDLGEVHRKVNFLVERALASVNQGQPEFNDPFSGGANGSTMTSGRPSINIAPNQPAPPAEDFNHISQRLNVLTTSVGQLLAIQTQQLHQANFIESRNNSIVNLNTPPLEVPPNQIIPSNPSSQIISPGMHGRPDVRLNQRQAPLRTWSTGTLELPPLRSEQQNLQRNDPLGKRRSVASLLRRDSSGVSSPQFTHHSTRANVAA
mgnify:CR=1 FL=1